VACFVRAAESSSEVRQTAAGSGDSMRQIKRWFHLLISMLPPQFDGSISKRGMGESLTVGIVEDRCGLREPPA
jgi:hypothetical protein